MKTLKTGTALYSFLLGEFGDRFTSNFGNMLWQVIINEAWKDRNMHCFTPVYDKNGLVLGVAEQNEQGYNSTRVYFNDTIEYNEANEILEQLNEQMFGLLPRATDEIIISSMRHA